jgi:hypothetical protein
MLGGKFCDPLSIASDARVIQNHDGVGTLAPHAYRIA